ncbi:restriction endonuclease [Bacillus badius]|uniref:Restriction endonuclease type IV Mrr domain-containing protein n=2 Tax=Bacillus badius TaxID=1455 RepID=A0ABR5AZD1_BACBA|nr:restriction endonuclease [Bacillus badius]KIL74926.1 hypothetical protein SD78_1995 [Bacillus badius]KIL80091.1 hypothetical protein SD77_2545 [Bacillus badius]KZR60087.1 hypothetical protein A3781_07755 [Bacillus badius]MED4716761.1 restriction endonuclease [Bacillus badius]
MARRKRHRNKHIATPALLIILVALLPQAKNSADILIPLCIIGFFYGAHLLFGKPFMVILRNRRYLSSHIEDVDCLSGHEFEHFLVPLFEKQGYRTEVTKSAGDFGADLILSKKGQRSIVQAKCYGDGKKIGVRAVQEVVGALAIYKASTGMVVTNRYFTKQAEHLAMANNVALIDRDELVSLMYKYGERPIRAKVILNEES